MRRRIPTIIIGYLVASFAACLAVILPEAPLRSMPVPDLYEVLQAIRTIAIMCGAIATFSLLPAIVIIGFAEERKVSSLLFYTLAGATTACLAYILFLGIGGEIKPPLSVGGTVLFVGGPGLVAGATYWLVTGRNAGKWESGGDSQAA